MSRWSPPAVAKHLLWIDCTAAALAGGAVLLLWPWLAPLYGLPPDWLVFIAIANLAYGSYSFSLALRRRRPLGLIAVLVVANGAWALACVAMAVHFAENATWLGHLVLEAVFVGGLAACEWTWRAQLAQTPAAERVASPG